MNQRIIIAVVGQPSSGKDAVAKYIAEKLEINHVSSGDLVREYMRENNLGETTRERMQVVANNLRKERGADVLVQLALQNNSVGIVVSGLRAVGEVKSLKEKGGLVIAVTAPLELRFAWSQSRKRIGDNVTLAQFKATEEKEWTSADEASCNVSAVVASADCVISNEGTLEDLFRNTDSVVTSLVKKKNTTTA